MLVLSNEDISKIISYDEMLAAIRRAYEIYEEGSYYMPDRIHVDYRQKNVLYMPCFLKEVFGTKIVTIFPENIQKGIPSLDGLMVLNDLDTGAPLCMMDGKTVTALRTGAVGDVAIQTTTPETVKTVGLIGAGAQGYHQLLYACKVRPFEKVFLYDAYKKDLSDFTARLGKAIPPSAELIVCDNAEDLVRQSDVVISATTATSPPIPDKAELLRGKHFVGIGSYKPHMREFPDALFSLLDFVYYDADIALEETGDLIQPLASGILKREQLKRFSRLLQDPAEIKEIADKTTLFKSVGVSIFDMVAADLLYNKAREKGVGYSL
ncbi:ornithine cyclodeaminase family protein [Ruminococcaceae bacterium OttesenSCG-928-I18]|nr:ornithine cyclodeaminase family protein [Ruminococcaceae bacterium OttesenSCG-928-I18]